ncbi:MAG TPA: hypothetical protein LFW21_02645 [Rickettsia endosymbiont of Pyrocoelia pectoralis]|nr:hypothetical protein [Rickettsia endosymbiont of Pyrocoelia pectoralis]
MDNTEEKQVIMPENQISEEEERLKAENARKERKVILITLAIALTSFIAFAYFFLNYMEEKAAEYKLQQEAKAQNTDKSE